MKPKARRSNIFRRMAQRSHYAYANARVRVRKSRLLAPDTYPKLLKMEIPEVTRFIEGTEYGREIHELADRFSGIDLLENSLNVNEERTYAEVRDLARGEVGELVGRYLERFTIGNIKTILRGRLFGAKPDDIQRELLIENREEYDLYRGLLQVEGRDLAPVVDAIAAHPRGAEYAKVLAGVNLSDTANLLQRVEDALDRHYYATLLATIPADTPDNELFLRFIRLEIDLLNVSTLLRFEWKNDPSTEVLNYMIPGGHEFSDADLRRLAEAANRTELLERLKEYRIHEQLKDALERAQAHDSLTPVRLALARQLADFAQRFSYRNPLSVLPIINYLMRKHTEVRNLRALARGKQAGLSEQQIQPLLVVV